MPGFLLLISFLLKFISLGLIVLLLVFTLKSKFKVLNLIALPALATFLLSKIMYSLGLIAMPYWGDDYPSLVEVLKDNIFGFIWEETSYPYLPISNGIITLGLLIVLVVLSFAIKPKADSKLQTIKLNEGKEATSSGGSTISVADELKKLSELRDSGIISDEEFAQLKKKLL